MYTMKYTHTHIYKTEKLILYLYYILKKMYFFGAEVWIRGLIYGRQMLYPMLCLQHRLCIEYSYSDGIPSYVCLWK